MELDLRSFEGARLQTDICIIGAGAAGIALASAMERSGKDVLLVESGGLDAPAKDDDLLSGETEGLSFTGLVDGRVRGFGGATRVWAGQCIRLDAIDYERRAWAPYTGWPIGESELEPFYAEAEAFLGLRAPVYDAALWPRFGLPAPAFDASVLAPKFTIFCREPDLKTAHLSRLRSQRRLTIVLNATVTRLHLAPDARSIVGAEAASLTGKRIAIDAGAFVLCGGGIENARLLLASNDIAARGIGNERDLVGRYFQDHPTGRTVQLVLTHSRRFQEQFGILHRRGERYWPKLALSPARQRALQVMNANCYPVYDYSDESGVAALRSAMRPRRDAVGNAWLPAMRVLPRAVFEGVRWAGFGRAPIFPPERCWLQVHVEQAPDPANQVTLAESVDAFGVPRAKVIWRLGDLERRTLEAMVGAAVSELTRLGLANAAIDPWREQMRADAAFGLNDAFHHAGATRMSAAPSDGVVNPQCRVHGVENLYVAGSSVFPASGYANPTLTLIALAMRLAAHLARR